MPRRIQRKRTKGWRMPDNAVYVGRPTIWGNPFVVGKTIAQVTGEHCLYEIATKQDAVAEFRAELIEATIKLDWADVIMKRIRELEGKDLSCWCHLHESCHADVLLELANR